MVLPRHSLLYPALLVYLHYTVFHLLWALSLEAALLHIFQQCLLSLEPSPPFPPHPLLLLQSHPYILAWLTLVLPRPPHLAWD